MRGDFDLFRFINDNLIKTALSSGIEALENLVPVVQDPRILPQSSLQITNTENDGTQVSKSDPITSRALVPDPNTPQPLIQESTPGESLEKISTILSSIQQQASEMMVKPLKEINTQLVNEASKKIKEFTVDAQKVFSSVGDELTEVVESASDALESAQTRTSEAVREAEQVIINAGTRVAELRQFFSGNNNTPQEPASQKLTKDITDKRTVNKRRKQKTHPAEIKPTPDNDSHNSQPTNLTPTPLTLLGRMNSISNYGASGMNSIAKYGTRGMKLVATSLVTGSVNFGSAVKIGIGAIGEYGKETVNHLYYTLTEKAFEFYSWITDEEATNRRAEYRAQREEYEEQQRFHEKTMRETLNRVSSFHIEPEKRDETPQGPTRQPDSSFSSLLEWWRKRDSAGINVYNNGDKTTYKFNDALRFIRSGLESVGRSLGDGSKAILDNAKLAASLTTGTGATTATASDVARLMQSTNVTDDATIYGQKPGPSPTFSIRSAMRLIIDVAKEGGGRGSGTFEIRGSGRVTTHKWGPGKQ